MGHAGHVERISAVYRHVPGRRRRIDHRGSTARARRRVDLGGRRIIKKDHHREYHARGCNPAIRINDVYHLLRDQSRRGGFRAGSLAIHPGAIVCPDGGDVFSVPDTVFPGYDVNRANLNYKPFPTQ